LPHRGRHPAAEAALDRILDVAHADAQAAGGVAVDVGHDVLRAAGAVDLDVARAAGGADDAADLLQLLVHEVEIFTVDLDDDLAADARDRFFDAVFDRLREVVVHAWALLELLAHGVDDFVLLAAGVPLAFGFHDDEGLGLIGRFVVGAVLGMALFGQ